MAVDKLSFLLKNPEVALEMGKKGREIAITKFSLKTMIERIEKLYG